MVFALLACLISISPWRSLVILVGMLSTFVDKMRADMGSHPLSLRYFAPHGA